MLRAYPSLIASPHAIIDIGANLTHESFNKDRSEVIQRAQDLNVEHFVITGSSVEVSKQALNLAQQYAHCCSATAGIHPHEASTVNPQSVEQLRQLAGDPLVKAIGECGLDFNRDFSPRDQQVSALEMQLALAAELDMPVFLHEREAASVFLPILKQWRDKLPAAVVHCFTGSEAELKAYIDLDCYIGITGWVCDERRGHHLHEIVDQIPEHRLLIETDAPYLTPRDIRPKPRSRRNEPCTLSHILFTLARLTGRDAGEIARQTNDNSRRFFGL